MNYNCNQSPTTVTTTSDGHSYHRLLSRRASSPLAFTHARDKSTIHLIEQENTISTFLKQLTTYSTNDQLLDKNINDLAKSNAECEEIIKELKSYNSQSVSKRSHQTLIEEGKSYACELESGKSKYYKIKSHQMSSPLKIGILLTRNSRISRSLLHVYIRKAPISKCYTE